MNCLFESSITASPSMAPIQLNEQNKQTVFHNKKYKAKETPDVGGIIKKSMQRTTTRAIITYTNNTRLLTYLLNARVCTRREARSATFIFWIFFMVSFCRILGHSGICGELNTGITMPFLEQLYD